MSCSVHKVMVGDLVVYVASTRGVCGSAAGNGWCVHWTRWHKDVDAIADDAIRLATEASPAHSRGWHMADLPKHIADAIGGVVLSVAPGRANGTRKASIDEIVNALRGGAARGYNSLPGLVVKVSHSVMRDVAMTDMCLAIVKLMIASGSVAVMVDTYGISARICGESMARINDATSEVLQG